MGVEAGPPPGQVQSLGGLPRAGQRTRVTERTSAQAAPAASCRHSRVRRRVWAWRGLLSGLPWARAKFMVSCAERLVPPRTGGLTEEAEAPSASGACAWGGGLPRDPTLGVQGRSSLLRAILGGICVPGAGASGDASSAAPGAGRMAESRDSASVSRAPPGCVYEHLCSRRLGFLCLGEDQSGHRVWSLSLPSR